MSIGILLILLGFVLRPSKNADMSKNTMHMFKLISTVLIIIGIAWTLTTSIPNLVNILGAA